MTMTNEYIPVAESTDYPLWVPITDPKWTPGYEVSYSGEVRAPSGKLLTPNRQGRNLYVSLRRTNGKPSSARLDKLILTAFHGPDAQGQTPVHIDGDLDNCSIFNLTWGAGEDEAGDFDQLAEAIEEAAQWPASGVKISEMGFTTRTLNLLTRYHVATAEDLTRLTGDDLQAMVGGGEKFVREVAERLRGWGFDLAMPDYTGYDAPAAPAPKKRRKRRAAAVAPTGGGGVEVHRLYKLGNLQLTVNDKGQGELSKKSRLTTTDMATLAELLQRAVEMNRIMGLK